MRKKEFMDSLRYYFRKSDKDDLKGIIKDCEDRFRKGADQGKSEEEICCELGSPINIYRYYIGKPIVPEDNPTMPDRRRGRTYDPDPHHSNQPYDWEKEPERIHRRQASESYYRRPSYDDSRYDRRPPVYDEDEGYDDWEPARKSSSSTASRIANPFLQILGAIFHIISGMLFIVLAAAILAGIAITCMPLYLYSDLLPLPTLSTTTILFTILAILFAALTMQYLGQFCSEPPAKQHTSHRTPRHRRSERRPSSWQR
jgi:uncharacterized membrane protein